MATISGTTVTAPVTFGLETYPSPLTIASDGAVSVATGNAVYAGSSYPNPSLVNQGSINAHAGFGVDLRAGGTVNNSGFISSSARGVSIESNSGIVTNSGTIRGAAYGVYLVAGGFVSNSASGLIAESTNGINEYAIAANGGTVVNFGSVSGAHGGIQLRAPGTVVNGGTISAGDNNAVSFDNFGNNRLVLYAGYSFGGGAIASVVSTDNVLELAAGSGPGTLTSLNEFAAFPTITVDNGGTWTLNGTNALASGLTLTGPGTLTNGGTLSIASGGTLLVEAGTLVNSNVITIAGGSNFTAVTLGNGGYFLNAAGAYVAGNYGVLGTGTGAKLVNAGRINGATAVKFLSSGEIDNSGHIYSLALYGGGTITNSAGGLLGGIFLNPPRGPIYANGAAVTVWNAGTIEGDEHSIQLRGGGLISNSAGALLFAFAPDPTTGAVELDAPGTVVNYGTIAGPGAGVQLFAGGTVINGGTITEKYTSSSLAAVTFYGTGNNLLWHREQPAGTAPRIRVFRQSRRPRNPQCPGIGHRHRHRHDQPYRQHAVQRIRHHHGRRQRKLGAGRQ